MPTLAPATICAKSKGGILKTFGWSEYGCYKINTLSDETESSFPESTQAFPTIKELAQLSQHVYTISDLDEDTKVPFVIEHLADWICIGTGRYSDGYCGAAYVNHKYSHVVIAHGGTEPRYIRKPVEFYRDAIITDICGVGLNKDVSQISSAYIFTKIIVNLCSDTQFSISVTGHSLGGWLAQICAFYIEHPTYISQNQEVRKVIGDKQKNLNITDSVEIRKAYHLHTMSFDSPGCRRALKKIVGHYGRKAIEWRENVDTLDFTVIIAPSNVVNTCGEHVGYVLTLEMEGVQEISWLDASHDKQYFVDHLSVEHPKLKEVHDVNYRKVVKSEVESIIIDQWYLGRAHSCQVNIFSPKELTFLTHAQIILKWRNNEGIEGSDITIFEADKHNEARKILKYMDNLILKDFVQYFIVGNNAINFPDKILKDKDINMPKLIWNLIRWLRLKESRDWLNGTEFQNVIRDLPGCRQMLCESEGSLYTKRLPKLKDGECTTRGLCGTVKAFLESEKHFLPIRADKDGRQSRLYMVHIFKCFKNYYKDEVGEHILFINISIVQRLSSEIKMAEIFSQTKFRLIVVECDSDIEEMNDVIKGMKENAEKENKKFIIITSGDNCIPVNNYNPLECVVDSALQFKRLDESSKKVISQCHVEMHGNTIMFAKSDSPCGQYLLEDVEMFLKTFNSSEIICDIFDGKIIDLSGGSLPIMANHYISRTLFQITLDVGKLKNDLKDFSDTILVSNGETSVRILFPDLIPLFDGDLIYEPPDGEYSREDFLNDCASKTKLMSKNVHWFKVEKHEEISILVWQMSNGQTCLDYLINSNVESGISDSDLHELKNNFIILADEPGMGKSAAITKLFLEYRNTQFNSTNSHFNWPVYINLNNHQVDLKDKAYSSDSAISFLTKSSNLEGDFEKLLFKFCLEKTGNLTFFIDSFDEISQEGQYFVVQMLQQLKSMTHSNIRVWIATRKYAKYELERVLGNKSYRFQRLEVAAQIKFLVNYWTHNISNKQIENSEKFAEIFATRAIKKIREAIGTDHTFIGIPLQLVLLALIYNDKFHQLLENKVGDSVEGIPLSLSDADWENSSHKFSSTLELYDIFVNKKMNIWLEDKFQLQTRSNWMDDTLKARMNKIHSHAAFLYVSVMLSLDINIQSLSSADSYEVNRVGFCEISDVLEPNFRFYHQTIAEYFTAKYLVNLIRKKHKSNVVSFLETHYHQPYFKKIRYFLDSLLCTDIPILENLELLDTGGDNLKEQSLRDRFKNGGWDGVDALGRNLLHYAMAYGDHDSGIFWIIAKGFSLFHERDLLGETCLSYLCLSEGFPDRIYVILHNNLAYTREILAHRKFGKIDYGFPRHIIGVQVLYSLFCGSSFEVQGIVYDLKAIELNKSSGVALDGLIIPFNFIASSNRDMFLDFIKNTEVDQLTKNVEINMTWLSHYIENGFGEMHTFLERLCLHNSLDKKSENKFLNEWCETCLSEKADNRSLKLGSMLIEACKGIDKLDYEWVLQILRNYLPHYYHNALPYMYPSLEYDLWKSCTDIKDKWKMLLVMKNHNFYSLMTATSWESRLVKEVTEFVYHESGGEFRGAMNEGLTKAFHVFIFSNDHSSAFAIYEVSDEEAKEQMIMENFEFQPSNVVHDKPKLSLKSAQTIWDIMNGKNNLWALSSPPRIKLRDFRTQFFTLPVLADYPKE